ncbi:ATP-binding protein [Pseudoalteromonas piscicida]|uniref:histidine kinase n=1 Tax=Pseudoalteromonas piscicida TaxID=43662 RepID=A0AAQ2EYL5_PSEO7|nr:MULTISPECIES: ATP-binding protein [Pseudoalteromonas]KJY89560.1 hypothetical protein TW75_09925 [Pseudoalteromonas piscicida]TMN33698.1 ATP-binding protein [Pseudoalteromonas piscicida]TMN42124.1 ATP-binding protein [Pseudoalteromonas piscicida]TMN48588.1 ATP-binding protein [Pseudoalteromonas piscicida]TMN53176.1 ATP-binding protein [Pseudoalteromonas piscicida]
MNKETEQLIAESLHELRTFNQKLNTAVSLVSKEIRCNKQGEKVGIEFLPEKADSLRRHVDVINYTSQLITTRLDFVDYELNPEFFSNMVPYEIDIYGKFHKARISLNSTIKKHNVIVNLSNEINKLRTIKAVSLIDILPYLLLENAVKYAPQESQVSVDFTQYSSAIEITISSEGPFTPKEEVKKLFLKGYRGENAKRLDVEGRGIGLYFADKIVKLHDASLAISSSSRNTFSYNGVKYSDFKVRLTFPFK